MDNDRDLDAALDDLPNRVVQCETVRDVAAGAVDVHGNGLAAGVGELAQPFDGDLRAVLVDVAYEVDVAQAIRLFLPEDVTDGIDQLAEQTIVQLAHA